MIFISDFECTEMYTILRETDEVFFDYLLLFLKYELTCLLGGGLKDERDAMQALDLLYRRVEVRPPYSHGP